MLIEVKVKVKRIIDGKTRKQTDTYIKDDSVFANAELAVMQHLSVEQNEDGTVEDFEIQSLRISPVREIAGQYQGEHSFIATLEDVFITDDGTERHLKYKVLLWADDLTQANRNTQQLAREGYNMLIKGIKQVDYIYLTDSAEDGSQS